MAVQLEVRAHGPAADQSADMLAHGQWATAAISGATRDPTEPGLNAGWHSAHGRAWISLRQKTRLSTGLLGWHRYCYQAW